VAANLDWTNQPSQGLSAARSASQHQLAGAHQPSSLSRSSSLPKIMRDLMDEGTAHLVGDLLFGPAGRADRLALDDPVRENPGIIWRPAGQRDALIQPEQARRARPVLDGHCPLRISRPRPSGRPSSAVMTISSNRPGSMSTCLLSGLVVAASDALARR
jgi:hypothetical protein